MIRKEGRKVKKEERKKEKRKGRERKKKYLMNTKILTTETKEIGYILLTVILFLALLPIIIVTTAIY